MSVLTPYKELLFSLFQALASVSSAVLLLVLYREAVVPAFNYMGFLYHSPEPVLILFALVLIGLLALFLPQKMRLPSDLFAWLFFVIVVVPSLTIPLVSASSLDPLLYGVMALTMSVALLFFVWFPNIPAVFGERLAMPAGVFWVLFGALLVGCLLVLMLDFRSGLGRLLSLSAYSDIYNLRFSYREQVGSGFPLSPYFLLWTSKVLVPLLMVWAIVRRRWLIVVFSVFLQILMFSISGHKSFILSLVLVAGVLWLFSRERGGVWFVSGILFLAVSSTFLFYVLDNSLLVNVVIRRALMVPGMLTGFYYEYFNNHGLALYSQNFLQGWTTSAYTRPPAFEIGYEYFGRNETSSNVHFWADAFANLGYFAVIGVSLFVGVMLAFINALARSRERLLVVGLFVVPFWTLLESSLNTTLISHGLALALVLAVLMPLGSCKSNEKVKGAPDE